MLNTNERYALERAARLLDQQGHKIEVQAEAQAVIEAVLDGQGEDVLDQAVRAARALDWNAQLIDYDAGDEDENERPMARLVVSRYTLHGADLARMAEQAALTGGSFSVNHGDKRIDAVILYRTPAVVETDGDGD